MNKSFLEEYKICDLIKDPFTLRRIFLLLTRNHFSSVDNFGNVPEIYKKFYYTDSDDSPLNIDLDYIYNLDEGEKFPSIYVGLEDFTFTGNKVVDDLHSINKERSGERSWNVINTALKIQHMSANPDDVLILSTLSTAFYRGITKFLKETLKFTTFSVVQQTKPQLIKDSSKPIFNSTLMAAITYNEYWATNTESHRVKNININFN